MVCEAANRFVGGWNIVMDDIGFATVSHQDSLKLIPLHGEMKER